MLEARAAARDAVAARLGAFGRRIGTVTGSGEIEIRVADGAGGRSAAPVGISGHVTLAVEDARRAFGCRSPSP
ncbi:MAG: hypothetical protein OXP08_04705 [bacterium]|nr:hypothetical protein [bacterium]